MTRQVHRVYTATGVQEFPDLGFALGWIAANAAGQVVRVTRVVESETEHATYGTAVSPALPPPPTNLPALTAAQFTRTVHTQGGAS